MTRKIIYVSGTRADFGLMLTILQRLYSDPAIDFSVCATAMHLSDTYGHTIDEIEQQGFAICAKIPVDVEQTTRSNMVKAIGHEIIAMTEVFASEQPDIVLLLGDRGEMLAAALAAVHLNIHVVHVHGGERSGTVDEMMRHAISKFAHYHLVATTASKQRLIKMGELADSIHVIGAPGLDGLTEMTLPDRQTLATQAGFDPEQLIGLMIFHPVVQEYDSIDQQVCDVVEAALACHSQLVCLQPNADAGGKKIRQALACYQDNPNIKLLVHLPRPDYLAWLANVDYMLGNSSGGVIEAASFNKNVVNVGSRQYLRERGDNVIDVAAEKNAIIAGIETAISRRGHQYQNIYGDGHAGERAHQILQQLLLEQQRLHKSNAY